MSSKHCPDNDIMAWHEGCSQDWPAASPGEHWVMIPMSLLFVTWVKLLFVSTFPHLSNLILWQSLELFEGCCLEHPAGVRSLCSCWTSGHVWSASERSAMPTGLHSLYRKVLVYLGGGGGKSSTDPGSKVLWQPGDGFNLIVLILQCGL